MTHSNQNLSEALQSLLLLKHSRSDGNHGTPTGGNDSDVNYAIRQISKNKTTSTRLLAGPASELPTSIIQSENGDQFACPTSKDILSGRGNGVNHHPGNVFFRELIHANRESYVNAQAPEKKRLIRKLIQLAEAKGHRFVKQDQESKLWMTLSFDEAKKKTAQALRENASVIKRKRQEEQMNEKQHRSIKFAVKRKLDDLQFHSSDVTRPIVEYYQQEHNQYAKTTSPMPQQDENQNHTSQLSQMLLFNEASNSLSAQLEALKEKQRMMKQLEREIQLEQQDLMLELLEVSQTLTLAQSRNINEFEINANDSGIVNFLEQKRKKFRSEGNLLLL